MKVNIQSWRQKQTVFSVNEIEAAIYFAIKGEHSDRLSFDVGFKALIWTMETELSFDSRARC